MIWNILPWEVNLSSLLAESSHENIAVLVIFFVNSCYVSCLEHLTEVESEGYGFFSCGWQYWSKVGCGAEGGIQKRIPKNRGGIAWPLKGPNTQCPYLQHFLGKASWY